MNDVINELISYAELSIDDKEIAKKLHDGEVPKLLINESHIEDKTEVEGVIIDAKETDEGVDAVITIKKGYKIKKPLYFCFVVLDPEFEQKIKMKVIAEEGSEATAYAFCTFPKSISVNHIMTAEYELKENARFSYHEFHYHGKVGAFVDSRTKAVLGKNSLFSTSFNLLYGRVGKLIYEVNTEQDDKSKFSAVSKVKSDSNDVVSVNEGAELKGSESAALLKSRLAALGMSKAKFFGKIIGEGDYSRGHVDCKEILMDNGSAETTPELKVINKTSRLTHEAAIGSVDKKELQTLEARGLTPEEAINLIVKGLLE